MLHGNWGSAGSVVIYCRLDDRCSVLSRRRNFSLFHHIQTNSGIHPVPSPVVTILFSWVTIVAGV
jgi:hypothetical protein